MQIDFSQLSGKLLELAKIADTQNGNSNNILDSQDEISLFLNLAEQAVKQGSVTNKEINEIFGLETSNNIKTKNNETENIETVYTEQLSREQKEEVTYLTRENSNNELYEMAHKLDSMLIANEITGLGLLLTRMPVYDLNKLAERYQTLQDKYNKVEYDAKNWYRDPALEAPETNPKLLFEETAEKILGMPYEEFAQTYAEELEEVAKIPPIIKGVSTIAEIILHEQAVAKLSETGVQVYRSISQLNSVLAIDFNAWENDIIYEANENSSEMTMNVLTSIDMVESNEYAYSENGIVHGFEMPENWLVKENFIEAVNDIKGECSSVENIETSPDNHTKKIIKDGKILIEKVNPDGSKEYYDISGVRVE